MRILFDQGTPAPLRQSLTAHTVSTAYEMGWSALSNGDLIDAAEAQFDVFVTTDQNLKYQQNLTGRRLAILDLPYASWPKLQVNVPTIVAAIESMSPSSRRSFRGSSRKI